MTDDLDDNTLVDQLDDVEDENNDTFSESLEEDESLEADELLESNADLEDKFEAALDTSVAGDERPLDDVGALAESAPANDAPAAPMNEVLSAFSLKDLPKRMRSQPLAAQSNAFITSAIGRIVAVIDGAEDLLDHDETASAVADLSALLTAAERRGILESISDETRELVKTFMESYYASKADGDAANPPVADGESAAGDAIVVNRGDLGEITHVALPEIAPDPDQPRVDADDELADSIRAQGVLQPIVVRANPTGATLFMIVDGERRWRGAARAGLQEIPARIVSSVGDAGDLLLKQLTFNDGKRLTPLEEARAWKRILDAKGWTVAQLASTIGKSRSTVGDRLAMLDAPAPFQKYFEDGTLSAAAAPILRPFADLPTPVLDKMVQHIVESDYNWHQAVKQQKALPLDDLKTALSSTLRYPFAPVEPGAEDYEGETFEMKGQRYAVDRSEYYKFTDKKRRTADRALGTSSPKQEDWQKRQAKEEEKRRGQRERDGVLRRAQVAAVNAKLPSEISGPWLLLVIENVLGAIGFGSDEALAEMLGLELPKGRAADTWLENHAKSLDAKGRAKFLLQLFLAEALSDYGSVDFLKDAAALTRVDLKKIKPVDASAAKPEPVKVATSRAKKPAAKKKAPAVKSRAKKSAKAKRGGKR
jgi:ParB/RepB/Spo0J family partition protein